MTQNSKPRSQTERWKNARSVQQRHRGTEKAWEKAAEALAGDLQVRFHFLAFRAVPLWCEVYPQSSHASPRNPDSLARDDRHHHQRGHRIGPPPAQQRVQQQARPAESPTGRRRSRPGANRHEARGCEVAARRGAWLAPAAASRSPPATAMRIPGMLRSARLASTAREPIPARRRRPAAENIFPPAGAARSARSRSRVVVGAKAATAGSPADAVSMTESSPKPTSATLPASRPATSATAASNPFQAMRQVFQPPSARDDGVRSESARLRMAVGAVALSIGVQLARPFDREHDPR